MLIDIKNKKSFQITNKTDTSAELIIYAEIGQDMWGDGSAISAKQVSDELKKLPSSIKSLDVRVNSPGGDVFDGMTIYNRLKELSNKGVKITAYVDGLAASIASIIIMAADSVVMGDGALIMIHKPWAGVRGNDVEMEKMINLLNKIEAQMTDIYRKKTKMSSIEISQALADETWYNSNEALSHGLVDKIAAHENSLQIAASAMDKCGWIKNAPKAANRNALVRSKLLEFNNKVKKK